MTNNEHAVNPDASQELLDSVYNFLGINTDDGEMLELDSEEYRAVAAKYEPLSARYISNKSHNTNTRVDDDILLVKRRRDTLTHMLGILGLGSPDDLSQEQRSALINSLEVYAWTGWGIGFAGEEASAAGGGEPDYTAGPVPF